MTDLWGDIVSNPIKTPVSILREQGSLLEQKTDGVLTVKVTTNPNIFADQSFDFSFIISVPSLNYQYQLFSISHDISIYPVKFYVQTDIVDEEKTIAKDEAEFLKTLEQILKSPKTQGILNALLSQSVTA